MTIGKRGRLHQDGPVDRRCPAGTPHNGLLISLINAMGLPDTTFGNPKHCTMGPLPGLKA